jgi:hypothetical protein
MTPWIHWQNAYQETLALPDAQVRRARLEALDQALIDSLYERGFLRARPRIVVSFEEGSPQGETHNGAKGENPGIIRMRGDSLGRINSGTGCAAQGASDPEGDLVHRWAVLFHEAAHFTFDQLSADEVAQAIPASVSPVLREGLRENLWAPFLNNPERHRLNETFADAWSSAWLIAWVGEPARAEVERLRDVRLQGRQIADEHWHAGEKALAHGRVHVGDQSLDRILNAPGWEHIQGEAFVDRVLAHVVGGTFERWHAQGPQALAAIEDSWVHVDIGRLRRASVHARHHHDASLLNDWIEHHPAHPLTQLAAAMRWTTPKPLLPGAPWAQEWENRLTAEILAPIGDALTAVSPALEKACGIAPPARRLRMS